MTTETAQDVLDLFENHRDNVDAKVESQQREEVVAFVPLSRMDAPKGLPNAFHELAEEHHIRIVDAFIVKGGRAGTLDVEPDGDDDYLAVFIHPNDGPPADHYHEHWDGVPEPV